MSSVLIERAIQVLKANDRGTYTVPSKKLYPHQWAWDSAFAAIGWSYIDTDRAILELETLFSAQWEDGRIPHIRFDPDTAGYFPAPEDWKNEKTSTITQPPMAAFALAQIYRMHGSNERIKNLIPKIEASHRFYYEQRDPLGIGCVAVAHPWESGLDNSPAWDIPMKNIDPDLSPDFQRIDNKIITDSAQRPSEEEYKKYMVIVSEIAESRFGMGSFSVYDPMVTAILIKAEMYLAWLSDKLGISTDAQSRADSMKNSLIEHLWDNESKRFCYFEATAIQKYSPDILAAYIPIITNLPDELRFNLVEQIITKFASKLSFATVSRNMPEYDPRCYWRGPIWINMNWFLIPYLNIGRYVVDTLKLISNSGFYEYYNPETGEGLGAEDFTWTAALAIDLNENLFWLD